MKTTPVNLIGMIKNSDAYKECLAPAGRKIAETATKAVGTIKRVDDRFEHAVENGVRGLSDTKTMHWLTNSFARSKKPAVLLSHLASWAVTLFYLENTRKSEGIEPERKPSLMINTLGLTLVSSAIVPLVDAFSDNILYELDKGYKKANPGLSERAYKDHFKLTEKAKSLTIFTGVVRFMVPVLMVPVTGAIVKKFKSWANKNQEKESSVQMQAPVAQSPPYVKLDNRMHKIGGFKKESL